MRLNLHNLTLDDKTIKQAKGKVAGQFIGKRADTCRPILRDFPLLENGKSAFYSLIFLYDINLHHTTIYVGTINT